MKWPVNVVIVKWSIHIVSFLGRGVTTGGIYLNWTQVQRAHECSCPV